MHTHFLIVIKYTSGEFRDKMCPVLSLAVVVMALLSAGPASGAWYPPGQYYGGWIQHGGESMPTYGASYPLYYAGWIQHGGGITRIDMFQQWQIQRIQLLEMQANQLKQQSSQHQEEINQLKPLQQKVMLLETIIGVNLTVDGANLTNQPSIMDRLSWIEENQTAIQTRLQTFEELHELFNQSLQNHSEWLTSLENAVNRNTDNITIIHEILLNRSKHREDLDRHELRLENLTTQLVKHAVDLENLLNRVVSHNKTIEAILNDTTLESRVGTIEGQLAEYNGTLVAYNGTLADIEIRVNKTRDDITQLNGNITDIEALLESVQEVVNELNQTEQEGFSVTCTSCQLVASDGDAIKYNHEVTRIRGYSLATGCFTAPRSGLYVFFTTLDAGMNNITVGIHKNTVNLMTVTTVGSGSEPKTESGLVTVELAQNDNVCVKLVDTGTSFNPPDGNTFSGWLVSAN